MIINATISNAEYHSLPHISSTQFRCFVIDQVEHYERYITTFDPVKETDSMRFGSAYHAMLEGDTSSYVAMPSSIKVRRGKVWDEFKQANADKIIVTPQQFDDIERMLERVSLHSEAHKIVTTPGDCEISYFHESPEGPWMRARVDKQFDGGAFVCDYKSGRSASGQEFRSACKRFRYDLQQAWYEMVMARCGVIVEEFYFLVQKSSFPWTIGVFQLEDDWMERARDQLAFKLDEFSECYRTGEWLPKSYGRLEVLECPRYMEFE